MSLAQSIKCCYTDTLNINFINIHGIPMQESNGQRPLLDRHNSYALTNA